MRTAIVLAGAVSDADAFAVAPIVALVVLVGDVVVAVAAIVSLVVVCAFDVTSLPGACVSSCLPRSMSTAPTASPATSATATMANDDRFAGRDGIDSIP